MGPEQYIGPGVDPDGGKERLMSRLQGQGIWHLAHV